MIYQKPAAYTPDHTLAFGKNKEYSLREVWKYEPNYISWLILNTDFFFVNIESFRALPISTPLNVGAVSGSKERAELFQRQLPFTSLMRETDNENMNLTVKIIKELETSKKVKLQEVKYWFPEEVIAANHHKRELYKI